MIISQLIKQILSIMTISILSFVIGTQSISAVAQAAQPVKTLNYVPGELIIDKSSQSKIKVPNIESISNTKISIIKSETLKAEVESLKSQ